MVLVQCLTGMEIQDFPNISFEHPRGSAFKKYRSQNLAPVRFTNPNFNHRELLCLPCMTLCGLELPYVSSYGPVAFHDHGHVWTYLIQHGFVWSTVVLSCMVFYGLVMVLIHILCHIVKKWHLMRHFFVWRWRQYLSIGID